MGEGKAKILLSDGREVWRFVTVRYRDIKTGKYLSDAEVESLTDIRLPPGDLPDQEGLMQKILSAQARLAVDPGSGSKGTSAARVVMQILNSMKESSVDLPGNDPALVLGRDLAVDILTLLASSVKKEIGQ